ncbi:sensor histidine kinase [Vibrio sp. M260112]|uniref:sensor histidine kinase n=1 Tax=Vibrio sp. M260112 TaxID=3020895 RepID=UPI002F42578A
MDITSDKDREQQDPLKLKIDAYVIQQLGAELISGPDIALVELIKNSHDADASFCYIEVDTEYQETIEHLEIINGKEVKTERTYKGRISVRDNGHGMNRDRINRSWLTVSYSEKKEKKANHQLTKKYDRTLVGDKGLGRLGSMQLGALCRISTYDTPNKPGIRVSFDWDDFTHGKTIDTIKIEEQQLPPKAVCGTVIEAIGIRNLDFWNSQDSNYIKNKIASMVSPHGQISDFKTFYVHNGVNEELEVVSDKLLSQASSIFELEITKSSAIVKGKIDLFPFKPNSTDKRRSAFENYIESDNGYALTEHLKEVPKLKDYRLKHSREKFFLTFEHEMDFDELSSILVKEFFPGAFRAKIFNFVLAAEALDLDELSLKDMRESIKTISGNISVYRDGFKIGSGDKDWLGLSKEMTSGAGAYSLRPTNVTGYVNLDWYENPNLIEKSDRESFVENKPYKAFYLLCRHFIDTINNFLNNTRRESHKFLDGKIEEDAGKPKGYSAKQATVELDTIVKKSTKLQPKVSAAVQNIEQSFIQQRNKIDTAITENEQSLFSDPILVVQQLESVKELINTLSKEVNSHLQQYKRFTDELASHVLSTSKVISEIQSYEDQIKNFYDHVAIGLSAQTLAHEANEQIRNTRLHLNAAKKRVEELGIKDVPLTKELNGIRGDTQVLSKAISSLNPLVKAQRQVIEEINLSNFVYDYFELRDTYFSNKGISIELKDKQNSKPILFNRGKLYQVIDNIVRNSEHWLLIFKAHNLEEKSTITISLDKNMLTIWDSGKGIRPALEDVLFDMFATDKEYGQGLGLYIVQTLLKERECSIKLLEERNKFGRRYKFEINLVEALV